MDDETKQFLCDGKFQDIIDLFSEKKIDMLVLKLLTEVDLKDIFDQVGVRIIFLHYPKGFIQRNEVIESPLYCHRPSSRKTVMVDAPDACCSFSSESEPSSLNSAPSSTKKRKSEEYVKSNVHLNEICLDNVLKEFSVEGAALVERKLNSRKNFLLCDREISVLVSAIVKYASLHCGKTLAQSSAVVFEFFVDKIIKMFPCEIKEIYFRMPVYNNFGKQIKSARGKLVDRYYNEGRKWAKIGRSPLQNKLRYGRKESATTNNQVTIDSDEELVENFQETKEYLKYHLTCPWPTIESKWKATSKRRLQQVYPRNEAQASLTVNEIVTEWPILQNSQGFALLEIDFSTLFPDVEPNVFYSSWTKNKDFIKELFKLHIKDKKKLETLKPFLRKGSILGDDEMLLIHLPYLFKPRNLRYSKGSAALTHSQNCVRWSNLEASQGFISIIQNSSDLKKHLSDRAENLRRFNETAQPSVICVGASMDSIETCYVSIDAITYEMPSIVNAVDICFKCIHSLGAHYDRASNRVWLLLQLFFYGIATIYDADLKEDGTLVSVQNIISKMKAIKSRETVLELNDSEN